MDDHADIHRRRGQQIRHWQGVQGHRHALGNAVVTDQSRAQLTLGLQDTPADLVGEIAGEEAGVEGRQGLALGLQQIPETNLEGRDVRLGLAQVFYSRFTLTADVGYSLYEYNFPTDPTKEADNYLGSLGLSYKIWDWLNAGVAYTYLKQDSNYPEDDYKDNRFSVSLRAVY